MKKILFALLGCTFVLSLQAKEKQRIISVGGSVTELTYALGAGKDVIAVDTSSMYPHQELENLPKIGYYRQLSAEGLLSLKPTTLIAAKGAGPAAVLEQLAEAGVEVKLFKQDGYSLEAWQKMVGDIASFFGKSDFAKTFIKEKLKSIEISQDRRKYKKDSLNAVLLMSAGQRGLMVAGDNTMPELLFELSGLNNVAKGIEGYKTMTNEGLIQSKIDIIVMPGHVVKSAGGKDAVCNNPTILLALNDECNLLIMDPLLVLGMGSRIDLAVEELTSYANELN